jgi:F-type H+-transporting ATPase subunit epsilon
MAATLSLEVVSPARLLVSEQVEMVVVPGSEGYFGVLPQHELLLSTLRPGVIDVYNNGAVSERYFVTGALATLTKAFVAERLAQAKARMDAASGDEETRRAAEAIVHAEVMADYAVN